MMCAGGAGRPLCYGARRSQGSVRVKGFLQQIGIAVTAASVALTLAACSGFGEPKKDASPSDPNAYPANYRRQIVDLLRQSLTNRPDFRGALIAPPVLLPIGDSQRYMVCVQFHGNGQVKTKVAVYFAGMIAQFLDATPAQCGSAAYSPFTELAAALPPA